MAEGEGKTEELMAWLYNESPCKEDVVIDDRWGKDTRSHHGGYYTTEYGEVGGDTKLGVARKFEECRGIGASFGYNRNETIDDYASAYGLVCVLVNLVSKGGNLLLDIGPTGDGRIPVIMQDRLLQIGDLGAQRGNLVGVFLEVVERIGETGVGCVQFSAERFEAALFADGGRPQDQHHDDRHGQHARDNPAQPVGRRAAPGGRSAQRRRA